MATTKLKNYRSGIFTDLSCSPVQLNHGMLAVGYGPGYWLVKNRYALSSGSIPLRICSAVVQKRSTSKGFPQDVFILLSFSRIDYVQIWPLQMDFVPTPIFDIITSGKHVHEMYTPLNPTFM